MSGLLGFSASGGEAANEALAATDAVSEGRGFGSTQGDRLLGEGVDLDTASERSPEVTLPFLRAPASSSSPDNQPDRGHLTSSSRPRRPGDSGSALSLPFPSR